VLSPLFLTQDEMGRRTAFRNSCPFIISCLTLTLLVVAPVRSQQMQSLQQFETEKREIEEFVERQLKQKFAADLAAIENLSNPFKIGERITISMRRGSQRQTFSGTFGGLVGNKYAKLDSRHILLQDLDREDRDRLYWNNDQDRLDKLIKERVTELEARMAKQRHNLLHEANMEHHYNRDFFKENVIVGNKIGKRRVFGDYTRIIVQTEDGADSKLVVKTLSKEIDYVILIDGIAVAAIVNTGDLKRQRTAFSVRRNDMDKNFADRITEAISVICHHPKIGSWSLKANPQVRRKARTVQRKSGPKRVIRLQVQFGIGMSAKPSELARVQMTRRDNFAEHVDNAVAYMKPAAATTAGAVESPIESIDSEEVDYGDISLTDTGVYAPGGERGSSTSPADGVVSTDADEESETLDFVTIGNLLEPAKYSWRDPANIVSRNPVRTNSILYNLGMDHPKAMRRLGPTTVVRLSDWLDVTKSEAVGNLEALARAEYRVAVTQEDDRYACYLQYRGTLTNFKVFGETLTFELSFGTDDGPSTFLNSLDVEGNWGGKVYIANEVAAEELSKPLQNVTVKIVHSRVR
jgi:hypothetical protein